MRTFFLKYKDKDCRDEEFTMGPYPMPDMAAVEGILAKMGGHSFRREEFQPGATA